MIKLNVPQGQFASKQNKYKAFVAGYGSGKTVMGAFGLCKHSIEQPLIPVGYFGPTYVVIRDVFYPTIEEVAHEFGLMTRVKTGDKDFRAEKKVTLNNNASADAIELGGPGLIRSVSVSNPDDPSDPLEGVVIKIFWDGNSEPAVDAPVDAFFINRFDLKSHWPDSGLSSMFVRAGSSGFQSTFPMPFKSSARIGFENRGTDKKVKVTVVWSKLDALPEGAMYFHAVFREQDYESNVNPNTTITMLTPIDPATSYVVLDQQGRGHYVGCAIYVESRGVVWWGEGDENTYIDGVEWPPQIQGTGTEDEFNWSWGYMTHMSPVTGTLPVVPDCGDKAISNYIPQLRSKECKYEITGENVAYRFRPSDYVPFKQSIKVSYEVLGISWDTPTSMIAGNLSQERGDDYASIAFFYLVP